MDASAAQQTRAVGVLAPRDELRLAFKVGGVVETMLVDGGDVVKRGQPLAALKRAEVEAAVAQAAEAVEKARRDLERAPAAARRRGRDRGAGRGSWHGVQRRARQPRGRALQCELRAHRRPSRRRRCCDRLAEAGELVQPASPCSMLGATDSGWVVRIGLADRDAMRVDDRRTRPKSRSTRSRGAHSRAGSRGSAPLRIGRPAPSKWRSRCSQPARASRAGSWQKSGSNSPSPRRRWRRARVVPVTALVEADGPRATVYVLDRAEQRSAAQAGRAGPDHRRAGRGHDGTRSPANRSSPMAPPG